MNFRKAAPRSRVRVALGGALVGVAVVMLASSSSDAQPSLGTIAEQSAEIIFREEIARAAGWIDAVADCDTGEVPSSQADWVADATILLGTSIFDSFCGHAAPQVA